MYRLLSTEQIRELERRASQQQGISPRQLMLTAGASLAEAVQLELGRITEQRAVRPDAHSGLSTVPAARVVVVAGPGNNGGDGWAAAWTLHRRGVPVTVLTLVEPTKLRGVAADVAYEAAAAGVSWEHHASAEAARPSLAGATIIVDAILGIGTKLPLRPPVADWCDAVNEAGALVVAADLPTGVNADTGAADRSAIMAARTLTFIAPKIGLALAPGALYTGEVSVIDLNVSPALSADFVTAPHLYTDAECADVLPVPGYSDNKFTRGRLLIVGGSTTFTGAPVLSALAAGRSGAGYVTVAVPKPIVPTLQTHLLTAPVVGLSATRAGGLSSRALSELLTLAERADAVLIGPGLGGEASTAELVRSLVAKIGHRNAALAGADDDAPIAVVLDADGLNAFEGHLFELNDFAGPLVLTPHAGELARLLGAPSDEVAAQPIPAAEKLAGPERVVIGKGPTTVIANAAMTALDMSGPSSLATAGTGDVLAGIVAALLAQRVDTYMGSCLAVRLHSRSASIATEELTPVCMTALDVIDYLPMAVGDVMESFIEEDQDRD